MQIADLLRPNVARLRPYSPGRSAPIKLASNENPLGPSPLAVQAIREHADRVLLYPDPVCTELTAALAEHWNVDPQGVVIGRGSDEIIHMLGLAFLNPGEQVIYATPPFALYPFTTTLMDCEHVTIPARDYAHDLPAMAEAITDRTKLVFVGNPYNPTGTYVTERQVAEFMERVPEHVIVALDEAYYEYVDAADFPDSLQYVRQGRNVVVLRTFSKVYALAGLRLGYGIAPPPLATALKQVREPFNVSSLAQVAGLASLRDPEQVERSRRLVLEEKAFLYAQFDDMGLRYLPTQGNFIFVDVGINSVECFERLIEHDIAVRTGHIFGDEFINWIRVTIGTHEQNVAFISALRKVLDK